MSDQYRRTAAAGAVVAALVDVGPAPSVHAAALDRLAREWPTLYRALAELADASGRRLPWSDPPAPGRSVIPHPLVSSIMRADAEDLGRVTAERRRRAAELRRVDL